MILKAFALYDTVAGVYNQPMFTHNRGTAIRSLKNELSRDGSAVRKNPEQFGLFEVGDWDDEKGLFTPLSVPQSIGLAVEFVDRQQ